MSGSKNAVEIVCVCCGELGLHGGRRLSKPCYSRHHKAGTLDEFPLLITQLPTLWRLEDYAELRARGVSIRQAAKQLGVTDRTTTRYEARIKASTTTERQSA